MSVALRHLAARPRTDMEVRQGGSGDGTFLPPDREVVKVRPKIRYSHDPGAELMPAAAFLGHEPDFASILEDFDGSPFDPARRSVLGRLMGMFAMDYQGARAEERRFLKRLLDAPNAREAYVANRALHLIRTPHALRRVLSLGVAIAIDDQHKGGCLSALQARLAAVCFKMLGPKSQSRVWACLVRAGQGPKGEIALDASPLLERAFVLKALAAQRAELGPWGPESGERALQGVESFATAIRGADTRTLRHALNPWRGEGWLARRQIADDPAASPYLHELHAGRKGGGHDDLPIGELDRALVRDRTRIHWALAEARWRSLAISGSDLGGIERYLAGEGEEDPALLERILKTFSEQGFDICRPAALEVIRQDAQGIYKYDAAEAYGDLVSTCSGAAYLRKGFADELAAGLHPTDRIALANEVGLVVPVVIQSKQGKIRHASGYFARGGDAGTERAAGDSGLELVHAFSGAHHAFKERSVEEPVLPESLGERARADSYYPPTVLDLMAPPFGVAMPHLGIADEF